MLRKLRQLFRSSGSSKPKSSKPKLEGYLYDDIQFLVDPLNNATINYSINVSLQHKHIYVETPKVACSSIKTTLQKLELNQPDIKGYSESFVSFLGFGEDGVPSEALAKDGSPTRT